MRIMNQSLMHKYKTNIYFLTSGTKSQRLHSFSWIFQSLIFVFSVEKIVLFTLPEYGESPWLTDRHSGASFIKI